MWLCAHACWQSLREDIPRPVKKQVVAQCAEILAAREGATGGVVGAAAAALKDALGKLVAVGKNSKGWRKGK